MVPPVGGRGLHGGDRRDVPAHPRPARPHLLRKKGLSPFSFKVAGAAALLALCGAASAHEIGSAKVEISLGRDGRYHVVAKIDADHVPPGPLKESRERLRDAFVAGAVISFDGTERALAQDEVRAGVALPDGPAFILRFEGNVPPGAENVTFRLRAPIGTYLVQVINDGVEGSGSQWLDSGKESKPFPVATAPPPPTVDATFRQYLLLGFEHILPKGLDHILFVLGLFLMSTSWRPLLAQVTAFTIAHSITLGLAIYGKVSLPSTIVEPLIAASIVYVAVENVFRKELGRGRIALVFAFGLLHGLGFAGVLSELGLPRSQFLPALLAFNVGVELGQIAVIALAFAAVGWFGARSWYRDRVIVPASLAIAAVGLYWTIQRI